MPAQFTNQQNIAAMLNPQSANLGQLIGAPIAQGMARADQNQRLDDQAAQKQQLLQQETELREDTADALSLFQQPAELRQQALSARLVQAQNDGDEIEVQGLQQLMQMDDIGLDDALKQGIMRGAHLLPSGALQGAGFGEGQERFGRVVAGENEAGDPVFAQVGSGGTVKTVEGFTPSSAEARADAAALKTKKVKEQETRALEAQEKRLKLQTQKIDEGEMRLLKQRLALNKSEAIKSARDLEASDQLDLGTSLASSDLDLIYGRGESLLPSLLRSQAGVDLMAKKDRFVGMLKLAAAGKMKGQGSVSDSERKTLNDAATVLSNPNISAELASEAVTNATNAIRVTLGGSSSAAKIPPKNNQGWGLMTDANGNRAYVGPNGEIEEVQ